MGQIPVQLGRKGLIVQSQKASSAFREPQLVVLAGAPVRCDPHGQHILVIAILAALGKPADDPMMRLPTGYNLAHIYYYLAFDFEIYRYVSLGL